MTHKHENLSAFIDGEAQDGNFVSNLINDDEMGAKWHRYHIIRQTLRKEMPQNADFDISASIAVALESEPAILAPKRTWRDLPVISNVVPLVRSGGQLAIAASVAVAVVVGVQQLNQDEQQIFNPAPASYPGIQGGLSPVSLEQTRVTPAVNVRDHQRRINAFINDHMEQVLLKDSQRFLQEESAVIDEVELDANQPEVHQERENLPE
ncbi:sigma-E factor negative regulatory protein [Aliiglaciecola lipolytica]|uniref:Anti-sigma-E factor RseA n=1 Tax=Aliiglaciecola lipolytica E3 TaxID=1127673 RepID=K6YEQ3_9ALTE|nr:RseA family anti-sigma factor [Aliiglaciecola lipolytica]GAC15123.1 sigma-E factor negative regulatory protein RseA [Aliiglaciecola lipolytica E3]